MATEPAANKTSIPSELIDVPIIPTPTRKKDEPGGLWRYRIRYASLTSAVANVRLPGPWAEFGVKTGETARHLLKFLPPTGAFHLFDSFEGLPEAWFGKHEKGAMSTNGVPPAFTDPRVFIQKGWFNDTLPAWVAQQTEPLGLIHIDCDIYSSTVTVLTQCERLIVPDTIIAFDEYFGIGPWQDHEYKAFHEYLQRTGRHVQYIGRTTWCQCVVRILE